MLTPAATIAGAGPGRTADERRPGAGEQLFAGAPDIVLTPVGSRTTEFVTHFTYRAVPLSGT